MSDYRVLIKKDITIFKNFLLEIKNDKKRLIMYLFYIAFIILIIVLSFMPKSAKHSAHSLTFGNSLISIIIQGIFLALFSMVLYNSTKECPTFFSGADMNLLFPSPISSKKILLYSIIKQSIKYFFLGAFFVIFQMPNIILNTSIKLSDTFLIYLGVGLFCMTLSPFGFLVFTIGTKFKILDKLRKIILGFISLIIVYIGYFIVSGSSPFLGLIKAFKSRLISNFIEISWLNKVFMSSITGINAETYIALAGCIIFAAVCIILSYALANDYYEDVSYVTERVSKSRRLMRGEEKREYGNFSFTLRKNKIINKKSLGNGAKALEWKNYVQAERTSLLPYVSITTLLMLGIGIIVGMITKNTYKGIYGVNGFIAYMLLFLSTINPLETELQKAYFYLIPSPPYKKIIACCKHTIVQMLINLTLMNVILAFFEKAGIIDTIFITLGTLTFYIMAIASTVMVRFIFVNSADQKATFPLFKMLQMIILVIPGAATGVIIGILTKSLLWGVISLSIVNSLLTAVLLMLTSMMFDRIEYKG